MIEIIAQRKRIREEIILGMISKGISRTTAESLTGMTVDVLWKLYVGTRVYFSKGRNVRADPEMVWEAFTGRNHQELAIRFNVSVRRIEQIIAERTAALKGPKGGLP